MNYASWHVGMKVVCVEDTLRGGYGDEILPIKGDIYTIREIAADEITGVVCVRLVEIINDEREYTHSVAGRDMLTEPAFPAFRFRPVQKRCTDISIFTAMLDGDCVPDAVPA